ncbi:MAG: PASTA domain-containing protein [Acidobacteria bacterium]|nr:PASTA domain-containing protein [Acidobacteriota bacterium]MCY4638667.1 PASTA domain-containing protein [Acidobacteriota bacterium]
MRLHARLLKAGKFIVLTGALGGTFGLSAFAGMQLALKTREVSTPDLRGLSPQEADRVLAQAGLRTRIEPLRRIHQAIEPDLVAEQDPFPGVTTRRRRSVKLWLSSGPNRGQIPALIGESEAGARQRLSDNVFLLEGVSEIRSNRYPTDSVVAQEPPPAGNGDAVSLLVNRGERGRTYVMPNLIGVTGDGAADILRARGFRVTVVGDHPYPGVAAGIVLRQAPEPGLQIAQSDTISLEVSR